MPTARARRRAAAPTQVARHHHPPRSGTASTQGLESPRPRAARRAGDRGTACASPRPRPWRLHRARIEGTGQERSPSEKKGLEVHPSATDAPAGDHDGKFRHRADRVPAGIADLRSRGRSRRRSAFPGRPAEAARAASPTIGGGAGPRPAIRDVLCDGRAAGDGEKGERGERRAHGEWRSWDGLRWRNGIKWGGATLLAPPGVPRRAPNPGRLGSTQRIETRGSPVEQQRKRRQPEFRALPARRAG